MIGRAKKRMPAEANSDGAGMGKPGICRANVANRGSHPAQNPQSGANASLEEQARWEQEARRLVAENMAIAGLGDEDLRKLPGSDSGNLAVARVAADHGRHAMAGRTFASAQRGKRQPANLWPPSPTPPGMRGCLERFFRRCVWLLGTNAFRETENRAPNSNAVLAKKCKRRGLTPRGDTRLLGATPNCLFLMVFQMSSQPNPSRLNCALSVRCFAARLAAPPMECAGRRGQVEILGNGWAVLGP